jgi:uncharacterized protein YdbL (DUF1318 family)
MRPDSFLAIGLSLIAAPLHAQAPVVEAAIAAGQVGERYDGYMGFAAQPSETLRRQVTAINIRRRNLYLGLAAQRNVTAELVGLTAACTLLRQIPAGEAYMLNDQLWRRRVPGHAPALPDYCR